jgi:hypothetical protein
VVTNLALDQELPARAFALSGEAIKTDGPSLARLHSKILGGGPVFVDMRGPVRFT